MVENPGGFGLVFDRDAGWGLIFLAVFFWRGMIVERERRCIGIDMTILFIFVRVLKLCFYMAKFGRAQYVAIWINGLVHRMM